jgi:hypothetical protein
MQLILAGALIFFAIRFVRPSPQHCFLATSNGDIEIRSSNLQRIRRASAARFPFELLTAVCAPCWPLCHKNVHKSFDGHGFTGICMGTHLSSLLWPATRLKSEYR